MKMNKLIFALAALTVLSACGGTSQSNSEIPSVSETPTSVSSETWISPEPVWQPAEHYNFTPAQPYSGSFWNSVNTSLEGESFLNAVNVFMKSKFVGVNYNTARDAVVMMDKDPTNPSKVLSVYDLRPHTASNYGGGSWNREHTYPQSKLKDGDESKGASPSKINISSDIANLFVSDADLNTSRSNHPYRETNYLDNMKTNYNFTLVNRDGMRVDSLLRRSQFSPTPLVRGEIARAQMYMVLMYDECDITENFNIHDMLRWDQEFPPTVERDMQRQAGIEHYQKVRNPFIDNRTWGCKIWGDVNDATRQVCSTVL